MLSIAGAAEHTATHLGDAFSSFLLFDPTIHVSSSFARHCHFDIQAAELFIKRH